MADAINERELVRALSREFDQRGWEDDDDLALRITKSAIAVASLDLGTAMQDVDAAFLARNKTSRRQLRDAIESVFAGRVLVLATEGPGTTVTNHFEISGENVVISGNVNVGSQQTGDVNLGGEQTITINSPPEDMLRAVGAFVQDALDSGFSQQKLEALDRVVSPRDDLEPGAIEGAAREAIEQAAPEPGALAKLRDGITVSTLSGVLVQAILAAITSLA